MKTIRLNDEAKSIIGAIIGIVGIALFAIAVFTYFDFMGEYMDWLFNNQQFIKK